MKEILEILENDARISTGEIATLTKIPEHKVKEMIAEAEKKGIIRKYKTVIDWDKLEAEQVYAMIEVKVTSEREVGYDSVAERIARFPEVVSVRLVSGDHDLSLLVRGKTMKEVAFFIAEKVAPLDRVQGTVTHFILKTYKQDGDILLEKEESKRLAITP